MNGKILIIGGAGYIGTVLGRYLIKKKYEVVCLDNFIYGNLFSLSELKKSENFSLISGDLRDQNILEKAFKSVDSVIILAGLVGDPITKQYPDLSAKINDLGISNVIKYCKNAKLDKTIFVSTCSNYGLSKTNNLLNEEAELKPISLYAKQKVKLKNIFYL